MFVLLPLIVGMVLYDEVTNGIGLVRYSSSGSEIKDSISIIVFLFFAKLYDCWKNIIQKELWFFLQNTLLYKKRFDFIVLFR